jgi:hypothetical protein
MAVTGITILINIIASIFAISLPNMDVDALIEKL